MKLSGLVHMSLKLAVVGIATIEELKLASNNFILLVLCRHLTVSSASFNFPRQLSLFLCSWGFQIQKDCAYYFIRVHGMLTPVVVANVEHLTEQISVDVTIITKIS